MCTHAYNVTEKGKKVEKTGNKITMMENNGKERKTLASKKQLPSQQRVYDKLH